MLYDIGTLWHSFNLAHEIGHEITSVPRPETPEETIQAAESFERFANILTRQASNLKAHGFIELTRHTPFVPINPTENPAHAQNEAV